ncbi:hypothetical protein [Rhodopirellula bahusiensis]|uniref:hypothetical protein n=1 Tax=Rhodopirellula bahusiensis TaxID=2014065 RepID=UPI003267C6EF
MSFLRVPRDRIIDAVPVALVLILMSVAAFIPIAATASMLHLWLWLRHPRSKSRYILFGGIVGTVMTIGVVLPLIGNHFYSQNGDGDEILIHTGYIPMLLIAFSAAGIPPILYRLLSRCSLTTSGESTQQKGVHESRTGISDLLALALLSAIVLVVLRMPREQLKWHDAPTFDLVTTIVFSIVGLIAMRINARCSRSIFFANFLLTWIGGFVALKLSYDGLEYIREKWLDDPEWLTHYSRRWGMRPHAIAMMLIALFPIICRRCGVVLTSARTNPNNTTEKEGNAIELDGDSLENTSRSRRFLGGLGELTGHLALLALISAVTLYPFTWLSSYGSYGHRVAGWPFPYWTAQQLSGSDSPWYWTNSKIWRGIEFSPIPLVANLILTAAAWIFILPARPIRRRLGLSAIRYGRITLCVFFLSCLGYKIFGAPIFRNRGLDSLEGVTINDHEHSPKLGLFTTIAVEVDLQSFGIPGESDRGLPSDILLEKASPETIARVFDWTSITTLNFADCEVSPALVESILAHPNIRTVHFENCSVNPTLVDRLVDDRKLATLSLTVGRQTTSYQTIRRWSPSEWMKPRSRRSLYHLEAHANNGECLVSDKVQSLTLSVPDHIPSQIALTGAERLQHLRVKNTVGEIPESACQLTLSQCPELDSIALDNYQKFDLKIGSAPKLNSITGFWNDDQYCAARLTSLTIDDAPKLSSLSMDVSECETIYFGSTPYQPFLRDLELCGHSGIRSSTAAPLSAETVAQRLRQFIPHFLLDSLHLAGVELDNDVLTLLASSVNTLRCEDCRFQQISQEIFSSDSAWPLQFTVPDFAPNDQQLTRLLKIASELNTLHISGVNLSKLPAALGNLYSVTIDNLKLAPNQFRGMEWKQTGVLELQDSNVTDEILNSWKMPRMFWLSLSDSQVTPDVAEAVREKWSIKRMDLDTPEEDQ